MQHIIINCPYCNNEYDLYFIDDITLGNYEGMIKCNCNKFYSYKILIEVTKEEDE